MSKKYIIIDVQGFKDIHNSFILKELCMYYETGEYQNFIIKSPYAYERLSNCEKRQVKWLQKHYHGISWNEGSISFKSVKHFVLNNISMKSLVYVKGLEKTEYIKKLINNKTLVVNIEDIGCKKSLNFMKQHYPKMIKCGVMHEEKKICALENALIINYYINTYREKL